ncbi:MAG: GPW/gp25 family protein [Chloroflexi bacterium]|nr:GPW/gp25 family protein [Chloroflexota bacterium]MBP7043436.1 GPW/gp25 family protein [Chloroflexota bacterium]
MKATTDLIGSGWAFPPMIDPQGGVALTRSTNEIEQAIRIILLTPLGQRVMRPTFGCRIHELVFAPNNSTTAAQAIRYVEEALAMWEPRIVVTQVVATVDPKLDGRMLIHIEYQIKSTNDPRSLVFPFYLIPEE